MSDITYNDIYKISFDETQKRIKSASEQFDKAQSKKKEALKNNDDQEVQGQANIQEVLNNERSRLSDLMEDLVSLVKSQDKTPIPKLVKYVLYARDQIKLSFEYKYGKESGRVDVNCNVTSLFHKTCRAQIVDMNKSKKRTYIERGIDHTFAFRIDDIIKYLYPKELHDLKSQFIGLPGIYHIGGKAFEGKNLRDMVMSEKEIVLDFGTESHALSEPIAITSDHGAIWKFDDKEGIFDWFWFQTEEKKDY